MNFGEKLLQLRTTKHLTQSEVAKAIGITPRSYIDYERGTRYPRTNYLYTENERFIDDAGQKYGYRGRQQANALVNELAGLFAGGELSDEDKTEVMMDIQRAYWFCKEDNNQKYTPKKYRKS